MRKLSLILLLAGCPTEPKPEPLTRFKIAGDVAMACLQHAGVCEDWKPQTLKQDTEPETCTGDWDRECKRRNAARPAQEVVITSVCQLKMEACVRLVRAISPQEVHHHR